MRIEIVGQPWFSAPVGELARPSPVGPGLLDMFTILEQSFPSALNYCISS